VVASAVGMNQGARYARAYCRTNTNGLAAGNQLSEATLHALYELIERDSMSGIQGAGAVRLQETCEIIDTDSIPSSELKQLIAQINAANSKVVLIALPGKLPVHTFMAVLLNGEAKSGVELVNTGSATHSVAERGAIRAITEAAQSRLSFIHGSREEMADKISYGWSAEDPRINRIYMYFNQLSPAMSWSELHGRHDGEGQPVDEVLAKLLSALNEQGYGPLVRVELTQKEFDIPVVKLLWSNPRNTGSETA